MKPFTFVRIDYLGPLLVKQEGNLAKRWICLFTCINVRAIHLELAGNMITESFLMCFRRFMARRGKPAMIISDNANQFKVGKLVADDIWNPIERDTDVQTYVSNEGIKWKFVTEYSPWQGGFYERLVGITKRSLRKSLGKSKMDEQQLSTILVETEAVINSMPLVYVENDINSKALSPADFITLNHGVGTPNIELNYNPVETLSDELLQQWEKGQERLDQFWDIWMTEYLQTLRERHTLMMKSRKGEIQRIPKVGEVMIVKEEGIPRGSWMIATVQSLIKSEIDNVPRVAAIMSSSGRIFKRPFKLLFPLEYSNYDKVLCHLKDTDEPTKSDNVNDNDDVNDKPTRKLEN